MFGTDEEEEKGGFIRRLFRPKAPAEPTEAAVVVNEVATTRVAEKSREWIQDGVVDDIGRLKEGGIRKVEGEGRKPHAEAQEREAAAAKLFEEGETAAEEREALRIKNEADRRNLRGDEPEPLVESLERQAAAVERLLRTISRIKQVGGAVGMDDAQLIQLVAKMDPALAAAIGSEDLESPKDRRPRELD